MGFCKEIKNILGCTVGLYSAEGYFIEGDDNGYIPVDDIIHTGDSTFIRYEGLIVHVGMCLSVDSCMLIKHMLYMKKKQHIESQHNNISYILKNQLPRESLVGRYAGYTVFFIKALKGAEDFLQKIFENHEAELINDSEGFYLLAATDDDEQEGDSIVNGLMEEKGIAAVVGAGRKIKGNYTIKDSACHAKLSCNIAIRNGMKSGYYSIDKMAVYGLIESIPHNIIEKYCMGGFEGFYRVTGSQELLATSQELFKCNLNISEASRNLFIHRNTLLYRLDKIKQLTGLDIKKFEDAVVFRMVVILYKSRDNI